MGALKMIRTTETDFDAIVIGSGISGGYAAMELCTKGYKTLVLERGRAVTHGDYPTAMMDPWDLPHQDHVPQAEIATHYQKQNRLPWWVKQANKHWINKDDEYPYEEDERFDWIRGHHTGGRSLMWGRQCYRWSDIDFEANKKEGIAIDWPIRYSDLERWYDYVETFVGVSGQKENLKQVPDGVFLKPFPLNCAEQHLRETVAKKFPERVVTPGRVANLSEYKPEVHKGKRGQCLSRDRCWRGCPFGAYFSSLSATLPVAEETGNLTLRPNSIVQEITYDPASGRATGVRIKDAETGEQLAISARIIFCNASTVGTTAILLNSRSGWVIAVANWAITLWIIITVWVLPAFCRVMKIPTIPAANRPAFTSPASPILMSRVKKRITCAVLVTRVKHAELTMRQRALLAVHLKKRSLNPVLIACV
jgi:choline dehydrogenase-like flavoprotein